MNSLRLWIPALAMTLVSLISYIDRNTLALLAPTILKENALSGEQYGYIISFFSIAYMLGNPVWGRLLDRCGVRAGMHIAVGCWSLASAAHALARGFWGFAAARAALGFGEGATFPGGLRTVVQTLPERLRSRGVAVAYSGGSLGAVVTPLIITPVFQWWGWRGAFLFTGAVGAVWLLLWTLVSRNPALQRPPAREHAPAASIAWRDGRLWAFIFSYALGCLPLAFVLYNAALYFGRVLGKTQVEIGAVLWIPPLGWEAGYFFWGWVTDRMLAGAPDPLKRYRRINALLLALTLPLAAAPLLNSFPALLGLMFAAMFIAGGNIIVSVSFATHAFTPRNAGLVAGIGAGGWSAAVAVVMPVFGRLFDQAHYAAAFWLATALAVAGYGLWFLLHARGPRPAG